MNVSKTTPKQLLATTTLAAALVTGVGTAANAAIFNWSGGTSGTLDNTNYDTGTSPFNGVADVVNITGGGLVYNGNDYNLEGLDTYNVTNGGVLQNIKSGNKSIKGNGATVNVGTDGTYAPANRVNNVLLNLSDNAVLIFGNSSDVGDPGINTSVTLDAGWTGEIYFTARPNLDEVSELVEWLDNGGGAGKIFLDGDALTSADFQVTVVTTGSGNEPAFTTKDSGLSLTLVPEPSSLALLGLGGLMIGARRRRK